MTRQFLPCLATLLLAGCGLARDIEANKKFQADMAALKSESAACPSKATLRLQVECVNAAENQFLRPYVAHQDLLNLGQTNRLAVAGKLERRQITPDDAALELAKVNTAIASELERRNTGRRSAAAQEANAAANAAAATRSVTCAPSMSGAVTCN